MSLVHRSNGARRGVGAFFTGLVSPRRRRAVLATTYLLVGVFALFGSDLDEYTLGRTLGGWYEISDMDSKARKLLKYATSCIHNVYATEEEAVLMPPVPEKDEEYLPSHIQLCYEWLRRESYPDEPFDPVDIHENRDICLDWTAPHYAMLEVIASSILNTVSPSQIKYRHGCPSHRENDEALRGFDWTTFQAIFQEPGITVDFDLVPLNDFRDQCKWCLDDWDLANDDNLVRGRAINHCFSHPPSTSDVSLSPVDIYTNVDLPTSHSEVTAKAPITAMVGPLKTRLHHSAMTWLNVTDNPPSEMDSGLVIIIDAESYGVDPLHIDAMAPTDLTSVAVIVGPLCVVATLPTGQSCLTYANDVATYFSTSSSFPNLDGNGVTFQISGATAATFSRAVLADFLICPPNTPTCMLPALGKMAPTAAIMMDEPEYGIFSQFFNVVGTSGNVAVMQLPNEYVPPVVSSQEVSDRRLGRHNTPQAPQFAEVQTPVHHGGFVVPRPTPPPRDSIINQLPMDAITAVEEKFPPALKQRAEVNRGNGKGQQAVSPLASLNGVSSDPQSTETVVTTEDVSDALASDEPLNINTRQIPPEELAGGDPAVVSGEMANDLSLGFETSSLTDSEYAVLSEARLESKVRIASERAANANYVYEIPCPKGDIDGYAVVVDGSYVITDNGRTVIVSDGSGTVTFKYPVTITTHPILQNEFGEHYTTLIDPILGVSVNITASGLIQNADSSLTVTDPVGTLVMVPNSAQGTLITEGSSVVVAEGEDGTHTVIEGEVISTGNENIPPSDVGTVVRDGEGGLALTATSETFHGFLDIDPSTGNTGGYTALFPSPLESDVTAQIMDKCLNTGFPNPVYIQSQDGTTVNFDLYQTFKGTTLDYLAVDVLNSTESGNVCVSHSNVKFGKSDDNSAFVALCESGSAVIDVFVTDAVEEISQSDQSTISIPPRCSPPTNSEADSCHFRFIVDCESRRRLMNMTPEDVKVRRKVKQLTKLKFAANIVEQCPELLDASKGKIYDHYQFGGGVQNEVK